ncbi:hypothetical protein HDV05_007278, partial [Chytridiales sp. JEL 0842]
MPTCLAQIEENEFEMLLAKLTASLNQNDGLPLHAFEDMMQSGYTPSPQSRILIMEYLLKSNETEKLSEFYDEHVVGAGFKPTLHILKMVIADAAINGRIETAEKWFSQISKHGLSADLVCVKLMILAYTSARKSDMAGIHVNCLFDLATTTNVNEFEKALQEIIEESIRKNQHDFATGLFGRYSMVKNGPQELQDFFSAMIKAYLKQNRLLVSNGILRAMTAMGYKPTNDVNIEYISCYLRRGFLDAAKVLIENMQARKAFIPKNLIYEVMVADLDKIPRTPSLGYWLKRIQLKSFDADPKSVDILWMYVSKAATYEEAKSLRDFMQKNDYFYSKQHLKQELSVKQLTVKNVLEIWTNAVKVSVKLDVAVFELLLDHCIALKCWSFALSAIQSFGEQKVQLTKAIEEKLGQCLRHILDERIDEFDCDICRQTLSLIDNKYPSLSESVSLQRSRFIRSTSIMQCVLKDDDIKAFHHYLQLRKLDSFPPTKVFHALLFKKIEKEDYMNAICMVDHLVNNYDCMRESVYNLTEAITPTTAANLLQRCFNSNLMALVKRLFLLYRKVDIVPAHIVLKRYMSFLLQSGDVEMATQVLDAISKLGGGFVPSVVELNKFLSCYARLRLPLVKTEALLERFSQAGVEPNQASYRYLIKIASFSLPPLSLQRACEYMEKALQNLPPGEKPDERLFAAMLNVTLRSKDKSVATWLYEKLQAHNVDVGDEITSILLRNRKYLVNASPWKTLLADYDMRLPNVPLTLPLITSMIAEASDSGDMDTAIRHFSRIRQNGLIPDDRAYSALINCLAQSGDYDRAHSYFKEMIKSKIKPGRLALNSMLYAITLKQGGDAGDKFLSI